MRQVMQAAEASAELARRMQQVGNFNKLQRAREQGFYADAALNLARAEQAAARRARAPDAAARPVGRADAVQRCPSACPICRTRRASSPTSSASRMAQRLDVQGAKLAAEQTAKNLGLTRTTRFVNVLEVGGIYNTSNDAPSQRGWEIGFELPLFDWGDARVAKAEADLPAGRSPRRADRHQRALRGARGLHRPTARRTTSRATTATRSCRCASASPRRTCFATTAC